MKKLILVVALLTMVAFVSGVMAQGKPAPVPAPAKPAATAAPAPAATPAPAKPAKAEKYAGAVDKVDEAAKSIVIKGKKDEKTIVIDEKTKITKSGKEMAFADLKKGMNVSVEYKKDGDKMVATAVKAAAPKAGKASAEKKEAPAPTPAPAPKPAEAPKK